MTWVVAGYALLLFLGAAVALPLASYAWSRGASLPGRGALTVWLLALAEWCIVYLLFLVSPDASSRALWFKLTYLGGSLITLAGLAFALIYSGHGRWVNRWTLLLLAVEPAISWPLMLPNEAHGLFWSLFVPNASESLPFIAYERGPWGRLRLMYIYAVQTGAMLALLLALPRSSPMARRRLAPVLVRGRYALRGEPADRGETRPVRRAGPDPGRVRGHGLDMGVGRCPVSCLRRRAGRSLRRC